jgi:16S rRNA (cytidine1402-2'-O)-methyltransferase
MLIVAATPIGNLGDHSPRLLQSLKDAALVVAEDTRTTKKLLGALGAESHAEFVPLHEHNERELLDRVLDKAATATVVLVSDAGMPGISDPGFALVRGAHERNIQVSPLPGPSAVTAALAASGLPTDRFSFEGFVPKKGKREAIERLRLEERTMVFFESPHRLADTLSVMAEVFGEDRQASVCRELSKMFEQVRTATLSELAVEYAEGTKGEITLVVAGSHGPAVSFEDAVEQARQLVTDGARAADAAREIARESGYSKRELYSALLGSGA